MGGHPGEERLGRGTRTYVSNFVECGPVQEKYLREEDWRLEISGRSYSVFADREQMIFLGSALTLDGGVRFCVIMTQAENLARLITHYGSVPEMAQAAGRLGKDSTDPSQITGPWTEKGTS